MSKLENKIEFLQNALTRLNEMLSLPESNEAKKDACIQRFEFTYGVTKKVVFEAVAQLGFDETKPKDIFKIAYREEIISNILTWDKIKEDRDNTSHEYREDKSEEIYNRIPSYAKEFENVLRKVKEINKKYG